MIKVVKNLQGVAGETEAGNEEELLEADKVRNASNGHDVNGHMRLLTYLKYLRNVMRLLL